MFEMLNKSEPGTKVFLSKRYERCDDQNSQSMKNVADTSGIFEKNQELKVIRTSRDGFKPSDDSGEILLKPVYQTSTLPNSFS